MSLFDLPHVLIQHETSNRTVRFIPLLCPMTTAPGDHESCLLFLSILSIVIFDIALYSRLDFDFLSYVFLLILHTIRSPFLTFNTWCRHTSFSDLCLVLFFKKDDPCCDPSHLIIDSLKVTNAVMTQVSVHCIELILHPIYRWKDLLCSWVKWNSFSLGEDAFQELTIITRKFVHSLIISKINFGSNFPWNHWSRAIDKSGRVRDGGNLENRSLTTMSSLLSCHDNTSVWFCMYFKVLFNPEISTLQRVIISVVVC